MQSADYVPGVSGWKIHDDIRLELNDGSRRIHANVRMITTAGPGQTNDQAAQSIRDSVADQASRVTAYEGKVTAQGSAVSRLTNRVSDQANTRASPDRDGYITGEKLARQAAENARSEEAIEPLRMGRVLFEGEPARQIRAAQELLRKAGMGQLEVVQRASELGSPFVVIDGQVFIPDAMVKSAAIDPCTYSLKVTMGDDGRFYIAGVGIGFSTVASELNLGPSLEKDVRRLLRDELKPGGMLHRG